jgi:citrate lyase beta subunit
MTHPLSLQLGASLYCPATRDDLTSLGNGKIPQLRSLIYCLEDAVSVSDLPRAMENLQACLPALEPRGPLRFVRVRSPAVAEQVSGWSGTQRIHGLVIPKLSQSNLKDYLKAIDPALPLMLTLETPEVFSATAMERLRDALLERNLSERIISLRVGGNDLFSSLGLRRTRGETVHESVLGATLAMLVTTFKPYGFNLTSPVYEAYSDPVTLVRELRQDLNRGLFGKTVIHPAQVDVVESAYRVSLEALIEAEAVLAHEAQAVFAWHGRMCEPSTHRAWAAWVLARAEIYGMESIGSDGFQGRHDEYAGEEIHAG